MRLIDRRITNMIEHRRCKLIERFREFVEEKLCHRLLIVALEEEEEFSLDV